MACTTLRHTTMLTYSDANTPLGQSERAYYLSYFIIKYRIIFKVLLLVYKGLYGLAPAYISQLLHHRTGSRSLQSSSQRFLSIPKTFPKTYGDRAFSAASPKLWNELPLSVRSSNISTIFKKDLKTNLFKTTLVDNHITSKYMLFNK